MSFKRKGALKFLKCIVVCFLLMSATLMSVAQSSSRKTVLIDIAHGPRFYNDPAAMAGKDSGLIERIKYMTGELSKNAASHNAQTKFLNTKITSAALKGCDLLWIHMPSAKFEEEEVKAIHDYLKKGGAMFIVMEVDYWSTLEQSNVNDIVNPFGIVYKENNPDNKSSGGHTDTGVVTSRSFKIPYHGARLVEGGTPFCYSDSTRDNPFGVYKVVDRGGRIVAMGDGMASLYMTSWEGVTDYEPSAFMNDVLGWLLRKR
jgi:hypothetical protein